MGGQSFLPTEILDYVETHAPSEGSPYGISQRELAKSLGYHPCSMSRPLDALVKEGCLTSRRGLVRDGKRRQLVYRLTEQGRSRLLRETKRVPLLAGAIPPPPNPFLGRRDELERLTAYSKEGGSVIFVDGPPGMGKTALISRHLRRVKRGRIPFWFTVRPASAPRQFVTALSHALSFLGAPQLAYYSQLQRAPVAREVADLVARALGDRELIVVVDDLQMADGNLKRFLGDFVVDLCRDRHDQVYIVGQETLNLSDRGVRVDQVSLGGLDRSAAHDLTDRRGGLAERFESVYQSTLGSPLLLQLAVSNPGLEADAATLPSRVVDRLSIDEIRALLPVALSNEPPPPSFVSGQRLLSLERLGEVIRMGVLQRTLQGRIEMLQVVRTALLPRVLPADEREAHLTLAEFYTGSHRPEAIRERFLHLVDGDAWKDASQLLLQQERALFALGYSEALRSALRHLSNSIPKGNQRARVLLGEAALLRHHSDYEEAVATVRKAISEANDDPRLTCEAHLVCADLLTRLHRVEEALVDYRAAERIGPINRRLQAYLVLSDARILEAQGRQARARYQEAFEVARKGRVTDLALESIAAWSRLEELESGPDVALRLISDALPEAREAGRVDIAFNLRLVRARAYLRIGQADLAEIEMKQVRSEAESLGYLNQLVYSLDGLTATSIQNGHLAEALTYGKHATTLAERLGNQLVLGHALALLCLTELKQSDATGNRQLLRESVTHGERSVSILAGLPPTEALAFAHGYLADAYFSSSERSQGTKHYRQALDLCEKLNLPWVREAMVTEMEAKALAGT